MYEITCINRLKYQAVKIMAAKMAQYNCQKGLLGQIWNKLDWYHIFILLFTLFTLDNSVFLSTHNLLQSNAIAS